MQLALELKIAKLERLVQELDYLPEMKPLHSLELGLQMELTPMLAKQIIIEEALIAEHSIIAIAIEIADTASSSRTTLDSEQWPSHFRTGR